MTNFVPKYLGFENIFHVPLLLREKTTAVDFLMKIETHNIVEDENRPFIQINDEYLKNSKY